MNCNCNLKDIPRITRGNDFILLIELKENVLVGHEQVQENVIDGELVINTSNIKVTNSLGQEMAASSYYSAFVNTTDKTVSLTFNETLPKGSYGVEIKGTIDNKDFRWYAPPKKCFIIVESTYEAYVPPERIMTYHVTANTGLGVNADLSGFVTNLELSNALGGKVDKVEGKRLSTNDFDNTYKGKLDDIDSTPTANSQKLVKSGGVKSAIEDATQSVGYAVCTTAASEPAKTVSLSGYTLRTGGSLHIKMNNANTASNVTLKIGDAVAKNLFYNGSQASASNTWEAGEVLSIYYDGTQYQATNAQGGGGSGDGAYDISVNHPTSGNPTEFATLQAALTVLNSSAPASVKKGGMTIKYIGTDDKYHQYRYTLADATDSSKFTNEEYWEKIVSENDYDKVATLNDLEVRRKIDYSDFPVFGGYVSQNVWDKRNNGVFIPVEAGKTYIFEPNHSIENSNHYLSFAVLTSKITTPPNTNTPVGGQYSSFATGYSKAVVVHRTTRVTMPTDAAWVLVQITKLSGSTDISPDVYLVEDKNDEINTKIAILNGVSIPFEFMTYAGYSNKPLRKTPLNTPKTRILLELPVDCIKAISLKEPDNYSYTCVIHDGILPTMNCYGVGNADYINTPIDIDSEVSNIDGFTPKTLLVCIKKGDGTEIFDDVTDIGELLSIVPRVSDLPTTQASIRTVKTFDVCPMNLSLSNGEPTKFLDFGIGWGHTPRLIKVVGGESYVIKGANLLFMLFEYDSNQNKISSHSNWVAIEDDYEFVPSLSTRFIRLAFKSIGDTLEIPNAVAIEGLWTGNDEVFAKRPSDGHSNFLFPVKINTCKRPSDGVAGITEQYTLTTDAGVIHLPSSYSETGTPTPLIIFIHGEADRYRGGVANVHDPANDGFAANNPYAPEWDAAGYAQMDVDLVPDCYNYERTESSDHNTGGTSDDVACIEAAYEWVINHFNIARDGVYLIGRSRGGQAVMQVLGHYNPNRLPVLCAISNAGANTLINYEIFQGTSTPEWGLFCKSHGLPSPGVDGCPAYSGVSNTNENTNGLLSVNSIAEYLRSTIDIWWKKAVTGLPMLVSYPDIPEYNNNGNDAFNVRLFDLFVESYKVASTNANRGKPLCDWLKQCVMRSPVPIRFDWCVGDQTQVGWETPNNNSYAKAGQVAFCNDYIGCKAEYRVWPTATNSGTQTNPHFHEQMYFLDGDYKLANGVVIENPSMARLEWLLWCQAHDRRVSGCVNPIEVE